MGFQEKGLPKGWDIVCSQDSNHSLVVEEAFCLLTSIHPNLANRFLYATSQDDSINESTHQIEALANWLLHDGEEEGRPEKHHEGDTACFTQRGRVNIVGSLDSPLIAYVAKYTTWEGKRGYTVVLHRVETLDREPQIGGNIIRERIEEDLHKGWESQDVIPALKQSHLSDVASEIDERYVLIEPSRPFSPSGQSLTFSLAA